MDMPTLCDDAEPRGNKLWAAMPTAARQRLQPYLVRVPLPLGKELYDAGSKPCYLYFPTYGQVSLMYAVDEGREAQVASVGSEGIVGIAALMEADHQGMRYTVHSAGSAYRLPASLLKAELAQNSALQALLLRYFYKRFRQVAQISLCHRYHNIEQQLCLCLLLSSQCNPGQDLNLTQELIAKLLGVRREGVTLAAGKLQQLRVIRYHRGSIEILNRVELEQLACECYGVLKN